MVHYHRLSMCEVPVQMLQRGGGVSSIRSGKPLHYMVTVLLAISVGLGPGGHSSKPETTPRWPRAMVSDGTSDTDRRGTGQRPAPARRLELVRSRRPLERYALAWLFSALALLGLALWKGLLETVAAAVGVFYPPNALFLIAFGFVMVLLLNFSVAVSRLSDQTKVLAAASSDDPEQPELEPTRAD